jgi:ribonuclease G
MKRILLHKEHQILSILFDSQQKAAEIGCYEEGGAGIGSILICRVKDVVPGIQAAFVDIGTGVNAYLPIADIGAHTVFTKKNGKKQIAQGDELLVQIIREPMKTKPAAVSTKLSISGKYVAVTADGKGTVNVSKKIHDDGFRERVRELLLPGLDPRFSLVLRTNAISAETEILAGEAAHIQAQMADICKRALFQSCPAHLYDPMPEWLVSLRDTRDDTLEEVLTDDAALFEQMRSVQAEVFSEKTALRLYADSQLPLLKAYSAERVLKEALSERVWLKSGGYLVIQPTEALVAIDVNSGKSEHKGSTKDAAMKLNLEAAREAARQIRLRNLSGIILIDFINMADEALQKQLLQELNICLKQDPVYTCLMGMTHLELTEITRKKVRKPLYQTGVGLFLSE